MFGELVFIIYLCQQIFIDFVFFCFNLDEIHSEVGTSCPDLFSWLSASSSVATVTVSATEASASIIARTALVKAIIVSVAE